MKNKFEICGDITKIFLDSDKYGPMETVINTADLEKADSFPNKWCPLFDKKLNSFYVVGHTYLKGEKKKYRLHRVLKNAISGFVVDHINGNTLDNRNENLRVCTQAENTQNQKVQVNSASGIRGVTWHKQQRKWRARVTANKKQYFIGYFTEKVEAETAVKQARKELMPFSER